MAQASDSTFRALAIVPLSDPQAAPVLYELIGESTSIGSAEDNAIVLMDASVAAHYGVVRGVGDQVHLLIDLGERWRARDYRWRESRPGDTYWCPRHGHLEQLDARDWCSHCKQRRGSLWLIRPLQPGDTFDIGTAFRATYVVQAGATSETAATIPAELPPTELFQSAPTIALAHPETTLPLGAPPTDDSNVWCWQPEGMPFPIYLHQRVNLSVTQHARQNPAREVGGVLLGDVRVDEHGQMYVYVTHALKAEFTSAGQGHVTFSHQTWLHIHATHEMLYPDKTIVGWYHTHPGWTIFLSPWDLFIHQNFFKQPWHIALVIDPTLDQAGFFVWKDAQIISPHKPIAPFRIAELEAWTTVIQPRVRIKLTDAPR